MIAKKKQHKFLSLCSLRSFAAKSRRNCMIPYYRNVGDTAGERTDQKAEWSGGLGNSSTPAGVHFTFFGLSFLILILILLLIRTQEGDEIRIKIKSKIKRGTQKCEMHPSCRSAAVASQFLLIHHFRRAVPRSIRRALCPSQQSWRFYAHCGSGYFLQPYSLAWFLPGLCIGLGATTGFLRWAVGLFSMLIGYWRRRRRSRLFRPGSLAWRYWLQLWFTPSTVCH